MKLSIIVPVYNVERFLDQCMESIVNQTKKDFEVILIDDGSTDSSGIKCDEWAARDARIKVIHKSNGGLMSAWQRGLREAVCDYVGFVDSDDWIDSDMYERLMTYAEETNADIIASGYTAEFENGSKKYETVHFAKKVYNREEIVREIYPNMIYDGKIKSRKLSPNRWSKLFKYELLSSSIYSCSETVSIGEDLLTTFSCMRIADSIAFLPDFRPYHYRINPTSMIQMYSFTKYEKLRELKRCMDIANSYSEYNFKKQINTDHILFMLEQLSCEILFSGTSVKELCYNMKDFYNNGIFRDALINCDKKALPAKHKLYLFLLKHRLYRLLIFIRKLKKNR